MPIVAYAGIAPVAGSTVRVFLDGTQVFATIYADPLLTPLANPFTADDRTGTYLFYADDSETYEIDLNGVGSPTQSEPALPAIIFNGETPNRTASLVVEDPETDEQIVIAQVMY